MKLTSRWMVFGVTSIALANVEQFGNCPARTTLWISITRHIAGRLVPDRFCSLGLLDSVLLIILPKIIQKDADLKPQLSHPLCQFTGL
jgi:hypothetical protein